MPNEKKIKLINPKREPLAPEKLRELSGFDLSEEQAEEAIWSLTQFAGLSTILPYSKNSHLYAKASRP